MKPFTRLAIKLLFWIGTRLAVLDTRLLLGVLWFRGACRDWLSISYDNLERGLIFGYVLCNIMVGATQGGWGWTIPLISLFNGWLMWDWHRRPDSTRKHLLFIAGLAFFRIGVLLLMIILSVNDFRGSVHLCDTESALSNVVFIVALYATSLPKHGDEGGKKRKAALAKIKALFGTSWMPIPVPRPQ
jgi:hypothetical protein